MVFKSVQMHKNEHLPTERAQAGSERPRDGDVGFWGLSGNLRLDQSITDFDSLQPSALPMGPGRAMARPDPPRKCVLWDTLPNVPIRFAKTSRDRRRKNDSGCPSGKLWGR
jgi:hypothetical protein